MIRANSSLISLVLCLLTTWGAYGQTRYSFTFTNVADIELGSSHLITVNLVYTNGSTVNDLFNFGVNGGGLAIRISNSSVGSVYLMPSSAAAPNLGIEIIPNAGFTDTATTYSKDFMDFFGTTPGYSNLNGVLLAAPGVTGVKPLTNGLGVPLVLAQFLLTGDVVGSVTLEAGFVNPSTNTNFAYGTPSGDNFDDLINLGTTTFNVVAIPEPTTWALIILSIASGIGALVWFHRRQLQSAEKQLALAQEGEVEGE